MLITVTFRILGIIIQDILTLYFIVCVLLFIGLLVPAVEVAFNSSLRSALCGLCGREVKLQNSSEDILFREGIHSWQLRNSSEDIIFREGNHG